MALPKYPFPRTEKQDPMKSPEPVAPGAALQESVVPESPAVPAEKVQVPPVATMPAVQPVQESPRPITLLTEGDAYLRELIESQPSTVEEAVSHVTELAEEVGLHRMSLPPFFEAMSYDCTRGSVCAQHLKDDKGKVTNPGKFVFRWLLRDKRAIDTARNVKGWAFVSRVLADFRGAPKALFSAHGGVELGDSVLAVMPVARALAIRRAPGEVSRELIRGRVTPSKTKRNKMLMTGNPESENVYEPDTKGEEGEGDHSYPAGALVEGRDFNVRDSSGE